MVKLGQVTLVAACLWNSPLINRPVSLSSAHPFTLGHPLPVKLSSHHSLTAYHSTASQKATTLIGSRTTCTKATLLKYYLKKLSSGSESGQSMMGTRDPTTPRPIKRETPGTVQRQPVQRKDPGMNAEKLNIAAPPPPPPSPTHADNLVSPFLVTDHPSRKPALRPPAENLIQSPFLVDPTSYPVAEEPIMFDLEDVLMESEIYPLAPPNGRPQVFEEATQTPPDRPEILRPQPSRPQQPSQPQPVQPQRPSRPQPTPTLPSMADMISELTGLAVTPSPSLPQPDRPSPSQDPAERPTARPEYLDIS